jgi:hypothetical protein
LKEKVPDLTTGNKKKTCMHVYASERIENICFTERNG